MKVLYLTVPSFFDLEIALIRELSKLVDIHVLMIVSPESMKSSAFSIEKIEKKCDIIPATQYEGLEKYRSMINLDNWTIANNPTNSIFDSIKLSFKIQSYISQGEYDLIHGTTNCKTTTFLLPYIKRFKNTLFTKHDPIEHINRGYLYEKVRNFWYHDAYKNLLFFSDVLVEPFCQKYNFDKSKISFSHLGVYDFLTNYPSRPNKYGKFMLFFGRITAYKGVEVLIKSFLNSSAEQYGYKLVIAGKGLINYDTAKLNGSVVFLNRYIDNFELSNLIRHSEFVVLPYLSATQSGCVMSAFAFNKPILATNVGDLPKQIIDCVTGRLCKSNDIQDLTMNLNKMMIDDLNKYSQNIIKRYQENGPASWKQSARKILEIYKNIVLDNNTVFD